MKRLVCAAAACLIVSSVCAQGSPKQQQFEARFNSADADHDGKLTRAEAQAGMPRVAAHFDDIDTNHVGFITLEQIEQYISTHK